MKGLGGRAIKRMARTAGKIGRENVENVANIPGYGSHRYGISEVRQTTTDFILDYYYSQMNERTMVRLLTCIRERKSISVSFTNTQYTTSSIRFYSFASSASACGIGQLP